jgi:hypothetical protein
MNTWQTQDESVEEGAAEVAAHVVVRRNTV